MKALDRPASALRAAVLSLALLAGGSAAAQDPAPTEAAEAAATVTPEPTPVDPYQEAIRDATAYSGLLTLYEKNGQLLAELRPDQLDRPYLMFPAIKEGIAQGMLVSGLLFWDQHWLVGFRRVGQKIQFLRLNTRFRASGDAQLQQVVTEGYGHSVLASLDILAENAALGSVLVDLGGVFAQDLTDITAAMTGMFGIPFGVDPSKTSWGTIKSFPMNVELDVHMTFASSAIFDMTTVPDSRAVPITLRYSLVDPPDHSVFRPRLADDRVGYYYSVIRDLSLPGDEEPFDRYLHRWQLDKANPGAEKSAPRKPIVFYLDKSIPFKFRPAVRRGILEWNKAFEAIGFVDAIEVQLQPDDADWDPEDVRYSTVRWSTEAAFSAIGPIRVDPRTGQIIDSDVLVRADMVRTFSTMAQFYGIGGPELKGPAPHPKSILGKVPPCFLGVGMADQLQLGLLSLFQQSTISLDAFLDAAIENLVMHEIGHSLGLYHNFKGSAGIPLARLHDAEWTRQHGLSASVMDYVPVNIAPPGIVQGEYFPSTLGVYDYWAIEYGYKPLPQAASTEAEVPELQTIAARSAEPGLGFAGDEDLYRWAYEDADPYTAVFDLSDNPLDWSIQRAEWVRMTLSGDVEARFLKDGERYQRLRQGVSGLMVEFARSLFFVSRYIGGYDVTRLHKGQVSGKSYLEPVSREAQAKALQFLAETGFDDQTWLRMTPKLLNSLAPETWAHWGLHGSGGYFEFPLQQYMVLFRNLVLDRILSGTVLMRVKNAELASQQPFTVVELFAGVHKAIWSELDSATQPEPESELISRFRRDLQRRHIEQLIVLASAQNAGPLQDEVNLARAELTRLQVQITDSLGSFADKLDRPSLAHLRESEARIRRALEAAYQIQLP